MHVNGECCVAALLASVMFGGSAHAWGDNAHKIICAIAFELAEPHTQDEIQDLIALDNIARFLTPVYFPTTREFAPQSTSSIYRGIRTG